MCGLNHRILNLKFLKIGRILSASFSYHDTVFLIVKQRLLKYEAK